MCSTGALHENFDFLYKLATATKADFKDLVLKASESEVTVLIECLGNVLRFIGNLPRREQEQVENIVYSVITDNNREILLQHLEFIRSLIARIVMVVYRTEIWCVLFNHG